MRTAFLAALRVTIIIIMIRGRNNRVWVSIIGLWNDIFTFTRTYNKPNIACYFLKSSFLKISPHTTLQAVTNGTSPGVDLIVRS